LFSVALSCVTWYLFDFGFLILLVNDCFWCYRCDVLLHLYVSVYLFGLLAACYGLIVLRSGAFSSSVFIYCCFCFGVFI